MSESVCKRCGSRNVKREGEAELKLCCKTVKIGGEFFLCLDCGFWWAEENASS